MRNAAWMLLSNLGRFGIQAAYFVIIGRVLGVSGFGAFAAALALVWLLVAFSTWGSGSVLVMEVTRNATSFPNYWGNALVITLIGGCASTLVVLLVRALILPNLPGQLVLAVAVSELLFRGMVDVSGQAFQAFERLRVTAQLGLALGGCRFVAASLFSVLTPNASAADWGWWYLAATAVTAALGLALVNRRLGRPEPVAALIPGGLRDGWYYSISLASLSVYTDMDKILLARLATLDATGIYSAAYRVITMAFLPIRSLLSASYARFFLEGTAGIRRTAALAGRLLPASAAFGVAATAGLLVLAPWAPDVLGAEYRAAVEAIRWLSFIPVLQSLHYFAADTLTGAGYQRIRSVVQVVVAALNVLLNLWLIPLYSWRGAAWASLASEAALALALWSTVALLWRRAGPAASRAEPSTAR